ncbi:MAG: DUF4105 domain-containing protein [Rudaea sp.]|uniref:Lnb N-terminal periplasmic domain-containing protein n=1 Tax=Rudaea sp. TaxID=2136325 RepID=UPI0039E41A03
MTRSARRWRHSVMVVLAALVLALPACWGAATLWYQLPCATAVRIVGVALWAVLCLVLLVVAWRGQALVAASGFVVAFAALLLRWQAIAPSNDRAWADDVARGVTGTVDGDTVTLAGVRDFDWRAENDYAPRWETRRYDLAQLESTDLILSYWMGPAIAHTLVSFGFADGAHVVFSAEIRRERGEAFSTIGGFFKQFELVLIAADERDIVRLRTNVRGEDVYLYRVNMPKPAMQALFRAYVAEGNALAATPRFYNTVTTNCTTLIYHMMRSIVGNLPLDWRLLLSGHLDEYVYARGALDARYPLARLRAFGRIGDRARASDRGPEFSADIRRGIPELPH